MRIAIRVAYRVIRATTVLGFIIALSLALAQMQASAAQRGSMWSFSMWCIDMEMLPSERCAERRPEDWTAYQAYVSRTQRFEQEITEEERRQAEALERMNRLNVNPGARTP